MMICSLAFIVIMKPGNRDFYFYTNDLNIVNHDWFAHLLFYLYRSIVNLRVASLSIKFVANPCQSDTMIHLVTVDNHEIRRLRARFEHCQLQVHHLCAVLHEPWQSCLPQVLALL